MMKSIGSLQHLRALKLDTMPHEIIFDPLKNLKALTHLSLGASPSDDGAASAVLSMLQHSASTLQALVLSSGKYHMKSLLDPLDWKLLPFTKLRSLDINQVEFEMAMVPKFLKTFYIANLEKLIIGILEGDFNLFFDSLAFLFKSISPRKPKLQKLTINMDSADHWYNKPREPNKIEIDHKCNFISSFDTLTSLKLNDYGLFADDVDRGQQKINPNLLSAILCHHNLKTLIFYIGGIPSGFNVFCLAIEEVRSIVEGLPCLEVFDAAFDGNHVSFSIGKTIIFSGCHFHCQSSTSH